MARRAKIVCTLGPAVASEEGIRGLVSAGMDVARLNFSHGSYAQQAQTYAWVREAADRAGRGVAVLADLQGPKIRLGGFADGSTRWAPGEQVTITTELVLGSHDRVSTTYAALADDVRVGDRLLLDDGNVGLRVTAVRSPDVTCQVVWGGVVSDHKGINLPGVAVSAPAMSAKDVEDLRFALSLRVDLVALSFVRSPSDRAGVEGVLAEVGAQLPVLAKIEKPEAVTDLEAVVAAFDGIMVARGDLGVEMPLENVPLVQKRAILLAREQAKPVIVATQMLESMITHPRPTRAEASDVANAVFDGADALMLSAETSVGGYPLEAVSTMGRIIEAVERDETPTVRPALGPPSTVGGSIAKAAAEVGATVGARALVAFTQTGDTVRRLARHRSPIPLLAFTPMPAVRSQLALTWGVETFLVPSVRHTDEMVRQVDAALLDLGRFERGDLVVIVAGSPPSTPGSTNALRVHRLGQI
ncbi:MAG: pyruvate kinase [Mycobacteriales bacterium]